MYSLVGETSRHVLIETYWNVKMTPAETSRNEEIGINRNILECKDQSSFFSYRAKVSINRNILECKEIKKIQRSNGNKGINRNILECKGWYVWRRDVFRYRINRNILECKVCRISLVKLDISVLIETYWNVKASVWIGRSDRKNVLIETYWNVKTVAPPFFNVEHFEY